MIDERALLAAAGGLRPAYEAVDWDSSPLGPMAGWTPTLRSTVLLSLESRFPITLLWGEQFALVYNEAYLDIIADKHPAALGRPAEEIFPEAWHTIGPMMEMVAGGRGPTWVRDQPLPLVRRGILEEAYFTYAYSPVRAEDGRIEGVLDIATETTREVIDRRRLTLLTALRERLADARTVESVVERALPLLRADARDLPEVEIVEQRDGGPRTDRGEALLHLGAHGLALHVTLSENLPGDAAYLGFLRLTASALTQALDRVSVRAAERSASETLQRSVLSEPPTVEGLELAARYRPASTIAQIGGDWYDAFTPPGGPLTIVIGDVTGHDMDAAAEMAQLRSLLRGVAAAGPRSPAELLAGLDRAMGSLAPGVLATAVVVQLERQGDGWSLRWSNAGHPPPVLVAAGGAARALEVPPDPLLGLGAPDRHDHVDALRPGATLALYTDGLIERRGEAWATTLGRLTATLPAGDETVDGLCDRLIAELAGAVPEDDVALLVARAAPA
ncbi:MAG TPA: PP2C family protein-serine/threonine phosphatase [Capillimicrobium sp.]